MPRSGILVTVGMVVVLTTMAVAVQPQAAGQSGGAQPPAPGQPAERAGRPEGRQGGGTLSVGQAMKGINRAIRQLRGQAGDSSKREENLRLVNDAQRNLVAAKGQTLPEDLLKDAKDEAAKTALKDHYRKDLISALRTLVEVEQAIFDNKNDDAKKLVEELAAQRDEAHEELGVKDE